jgi:hypothetical protein
MLLNKSKRSLELGSFGRRGRVVGHTVGAFLGAECITRYYMTISASFSLADSDRRVLGASSMRALRRAADTSLPPRLTDSYR